MDKLELHIMYKEELCLISLEMGTLPTLMKKKINNNNVLLII